MRRSVRAVAATHPWLAELLSWYEQTTEDRSPGPWYALRLFTVLEGLVCRAPDDRDLVASIGRQLQRKAEMLLKRAQFPHVDYSVFGDAKPDTLWKALYDLRSGTAHGRPVEFKPILGSWDRVCPFLRDAVRRLLVVALQEPDFVAEIREV